MTDRTFEERYRENDIPWDREAADQNLIDAVQQFGIKPRSVLDLGCGTGVNALWLAMKGFDVTGIDLSPTAIDRARGRVAGLGYDIELLAGDFLDRDLITSPFEFVFDRGAFHCFDGPEARARCAQRVAELLSDGGTWLSLIGNADDPSDREEGPPRMTAAEIAAIVEPHFEIQSLVVGHFGGEQPDPPQAWIVWMRKRARA